MIVEADDTDVTIVLSSSPGHFVANNLGVELIASASKSRKLCLLPGLLRNTFPGVSNLTCNNVIWISDWISMTLFVSLICDAAVPIKYN